MLARVKRKLRGSWSSGSKQQVSEGAEMAAVEARVECETFHRLEQFVGTERFLEKLAEQQRQHTSSAATSLQPTQQELRAVPGHGSSIPELMQDAMSTSITTPQTPYFAPLSSDAVSRSCSSGSAAVRPSSGASSSGEEQEYVLIDRQGAVEAMAFYIAETLMKCPQAFTMSPNKLQEAIVIAIKGMKQSRFKQICRAGHHAYRWTALGYSAFQMYSNPWICQAILQALWAFSRLTLRNWV